MRSAKYLPNNKNAIIPAPLLKFLNIAKYRYLQKFPIIIVDVSEI